MKSKILGGIFGAAAAAAVMVGATSTTDGTAGLVPAPSAGQQDNVLRGDGTWSDTIETISSSSDILASASGKALSLNAASGTGHLEAAGTKSAVWTASSLYPASNNSKNLGTTSYAWAGTYTNLVQSGTSQPLYINAKSGTGYLQGSGTAYYGWNSSGFYPLASGEKNLGTSSNSWDDVYTNSVISESSILSLKSTSNYIYFYTKGNLMFRVGDTAIYPGSSGGTSLGTSTYLWGQVYSTSSSISTSDARKKKDFRKIPKKLLKVWFKHVKIKTWHWKKEKLGKLRHIGPTAQMVIAAFDDAGIDWHKWNVVQVDGKGYYIVCPDEIQYIEMAAMRYKVEHLNVPANDNSCGFRMFGYDLCL